MKLDFIVIGCSRSGTTWIHDNIIHHPEIYLPNEINEPHFFSKYYHKGFEYYQDMFKPLKGEKAVGEITPDYIYSKEAARRIKTFNPNIKLIVVVRNPVDRLYSMYWILRGKYKDQNQFSFEEKIKRDPQLITQGFFIDHIENYLEHFNRDQIFVLLFDEIKSNPTSFLKKIYSFIGVDQNYIAPYSKVQINRGTFRKHFGKSKILFFMWRVFKKLKMHSLAYKTEKINSIKVKEMDPIVKSTLIEIYKPYNDRLSKYLGIDLTHWNQ